jgi:hypothetical protein
MRATPHTRRAHRRSNPVSRPRRHWPDLPSCVTTNMKSQIAGIWLTGLPSPTNSTAPRRKPGGCATAMKTPYPKRRQPPQNRCPRYRVTLHRRRTTAGRHRSHHRRQLRPRGSPSPASRPEETWVPALTADDSAGRRRPNATPKAGKKRPFRSTLGRCRTGVMSVSAENFSWCGTSRAVRRRTRGVFRPEPDIPVVVCNPGSP